MFFIDLHIFLFTVLIYQKSIVKSEKKEFLRKNQNMELTTKLIVLILPSYRFDFIKEHWKNFI